MLMNIPMMRTVLTLLVGILTGVLATQLNAFLQSYREDRKALKRVLYNLLDAWVEVKRCDPSDFFSAIMEHLKKELKRRGVAPEGIDGMFDGASPQVLTFFRKMDMKLPQSLLERYQSSVNDLAEVSPLLAYRLSGKPDMSASEKFDKLMAEAMDTEGLKPNESDAEVFKHIFEITKGKALKRLAGSMENDILVVALRVGPLTRLKAGRIVKNFKQDFERKAEEGAREYVDSMIEAYLHHVKMEAQQPTT